MMPGIIKHELGYMCTKCDGINECYCFDPEGPPDPICCGCGNPGWGCDCFNEDENYDLLEDVFYEYDEDIFGFGFEDDGEVPW